MKKLLTLSFIVALSFTSSAFSQEVHVEDCGAYAESNSRLSGKSEQSASDVKEQPASSTVTRQ